MATYEWKMDTKRGGFGKLRKAENVKSFNK